MLKASNLSFKKENRYLIHNFSYSFMPGHIYGILGPNGSGKTTLLKTLSGIWRPTDGETFWNGANLAEMNRSEIARILTFVSQCRSIPFDYPVNEIVAMGKYPHNHLRKGSESSVTDALEMVGASHLSDRLITELSHGERQRVHLAKALITDTPVLLLDEPATNLDIRHQIDLWLLLEKLAARGKTVIVSNHDLTSSIKHCNITLIMDKGECTAHGKPDTTLTSAVLETVFNLKF